MKVLFVSNLFPDATNPDWGIYNARLVKHLGAQGEIRVVSPRPTRGLAPFWRPKVYGPRPEDALCAPRFPPAPYLPKVGSRWNHRLMAGSLCDTLKAVRTTFPFEVVLVSWLYPDACAVAELAREMGFPFIAIAQGSDVHQYLQIPARRKIIVRALADAKAVIVRSAELGRLLAVAGVAPEKLHTIYNGVESEIFHPGDASASRAALGLAADETVLLYVGNFLPIKNPLLLVKALAELNRLHPDKRFRLVMVGDGPLQAEIERQARKLGLQERMLLPGRKPPAEVARFLQAADLLCVTSDNEGVPNVVLEAWACGRRVVATRVGGLPEIMAADFLGRLAEPDAPAAFARAIMETLAAPARTGDIIRHAERFAWPETARAYWHCLSSTRIPL